MELFGFKSFVDRTLIQLDAGISGIVGPNGCGKCVHGDTRVPLSNGRVTSIRDLIESTFNVAENIQPMDDGEYTYDNPQNISVLTLDPQTMQMTAQPVLAFVRRTSPETLLKITTRAGREIVATKYHPLFVQEKGQLRPIRADELRTGVSIASPRHFPVSVSAERDVYIGEGRQFQNSVETSVDGCVVAVGSPQAAPVKVMGRLTKDWGRFLGYILSEGQNSKWSDQIRFVNDNEAVLEDFTQVSEALFGRKPVVKNYREGASDCFLFSSVLCDMLDNVFGITRGGHSSTKRIPSSIFSAPDNVAWAFLSALIEGDGCVRIDSSDPDKKSAAFLEYASASEGLVRDLATLLLRFGIRGLIRKKQKRATNGKSKERKTYYSLFVYGAKDLQILNENLSLVSGKMEKLAEAAHRALPAASLDVIPNVTGPEALFDELWQEARVSIDKKNSLRGRMEAYRAGRCDPSREGLGEALQYVRQNAAVWNDCLEQKTGQMEKLAVSDVYWDEITSIEEMPANEQWVYDLCVERTHNFVANDLVVHNSNIVDAIRWAMGEQSAKHLRGSEMQDVIFNGTANRPPLGMSQVILTFDLSDGRAPAGFTDYTEIQVERRLYRSGDSEYYINKVPCRLRDVVDLFLGTGVGTKAYSIVEQGQIGRIVQAKPEERRFIIEEAAGISKFKNRKEIALRKMESTETNLARLNDIIAELKRQLGSLDRQARKAERYRVLFDSLKERELKLSTIIYRQWRGELQSLEQERERQTAEESILAGRRAELEVLHEEQKLQLVSKEQELGNLQEQFYIQQNAVKLHEASLEYQNSRRKDLSKQIETDVGEIESLRVKLEEAVVEMERLNQAKLSLDLNSASAQEKIEAAEKISQEANGQVSEWEKNLEAKNKEMMVLVGEIVETESRFEYLQRHELELEGRKAKDQAKIDHIDGLLLELERKIVMTDQTLGASKQMSMTILNETEILKKELEQKRGKLEEAVARWDGLKEELSQRQSRLASLKQIQQNMEGFHEGVRSVLKASKETLKGICGTVSEILFTDAEYEPAVEAVLGERLQYVVVRSQAEGVEAVEYLRTQATGRSTFIPMDLKAMRESEALPETVGSFGPLLKKIRFNDDYKQIVEYLLGDCLLVENLGQALNLQQSGLHGKTCVTLQGEVIDAVGVISGGVRQETASLLNYQMHLEEVDREVSLAKAYVSEAEADVARLKKLLGNLEERLEDLTRNTHGEEIRQVQEEKDSLRLCSERERYHEERDHLSVEIARCLEEKKEVENEKIVVSGLLGEALAKRENLRNDFVACQSSLSSARENKDRLSEELLGHKARLSQISEKLVTCDRELSQWVVRKLDIQEGIERRFSEINLAQAEQARLSTAQETERASLELALKKMEVLTEQQRGLKESYEIFSREIRQKELELKELRKQHEEALKKSHASDMQLAAVKNKLQVLLDQMLERYKTDLARHALENVSGEIADLGAEGQAIALERERLEKMGSVHVGAIEEYEELKTRFDFLSKQREDLLKSLEDLKKAIQKINRISRERFLETFEKVNAKFEEIFPRLFKGGKARLFLVDEENLLETGVEIFAQPPGKKLQSISLLSGGEKALTAVALIFSIFLIKPSPFCVLDEVDAPLDDANIDRFNQLLRELTRFSQFIVITHNKRTMEQTDCLYGITMQEAGVSTVVSVRLNEELKEPLPQVA